jgi:phosphatidate cytidylyltransferase
MPGSNDTPHMVFWKRLMSSLVLWTIVLVALFTVGNLASWALTILISTIALSEFYDILQSRKMKCFKMGGLIGGAILLSGSWWHGQYEPAFLAKFEMLTLLCFVLGVFIRQLPQDKNPEAIETMAYTLLGLMYIPFLMSFIPKINYLYAEGPPKIRELGTLFVFYVVAVTKSCDIGAYLVGRTMGRHKMTVRISPNKTWEGAMGGVVFSLIMSYTLFTLWRKAWSEVGFTQADAVASGLIIGCVAIVGDLAESLIKREANIHDSGGVLPGIGGALDLIDSLLFTAPVMYTYLLLVVGWNT